MAEEQGAEQRILLTAIHCINEQGINKVTVRMIAERAGVNVAAVNYYFRSKDRLMERAMELALRNMFEDVDEIFAGAADARELVNGILGFLLWGVEAYPGITRSFLYAPVAGEKSKGPMLPAVRSLADRLRDRLLELCPERSPAELEAAIIGAFSAVLIGCVVPELYAGYKHAGFGGAEERAALLAELTRMVTG